MPDSSAAACSLDQSDLFVFQAAKSKNLVIAAVFAGSEAHFEVGIHRVRIHANEKIWTVNGLAETPGISELRGGRIFAGKVLGRNADAPRSAVVLETPPDFASEESFNVWGEIFSKDGSRFRLGNPFAAEILARDPQLSKTYHSASPAQDRTLFSGRFAELIAAMAEANGNAADPHAHGRRLAAYLLPDVIRYRPEFPVGFTFASQNGRHPADPTSAVVNAVLTGAAAVRPASIRFQLCEEFPYFLRSAITT
jgi:hypothetical protein